MGRIILKSLIYDNFFTSCTYSGPRQIRNTDWLLNFFLLTKWERKSGLECGEQTHEGWEEIERAYSGS